MENKFSLNVPKRGIWISVVLKLILAGYFGFQLLSFEGDKLTGNVFREFDDTRSYYQPIELLLDGKGYSRMPYQEVGEMEIVPFSGRLPGLLPIYGILYPALGPTHAKTAMVFLQMLFSFLAALMLAAIAGKLFQAKHAGLFSLILYVIAYQVHIYDHYGLMESLSVSMMITSLYALFKYRDKKTTEWILIAGIAFAWSVFLRPVMGVWGILWVIFWINHWKKGMLFFIPLLLALTAWNIRNYVTLDRIILLEDKWILSYPHEPEYRPHGLAIRKMIKTMGGDILYWNPGTMGNAMMAVSPTIKIQEAFPQRTLTQDFPLDSLINLSALYHAANQDWTVTHINSPSQASLEATELANRIRHAYWKEHPVDALVGSRFRLIYTFLFKNIRTELPRLPGNSFSGITFLTKGFYIFFYYLVTILGIICSLWVLWKGKRLEKWLALFPWIMILYLTCSAGMIEHRYLLPIFPFWVLMLTFGVSRFSN